MNKPAKLSIMRSGTTSRVITSVCIDFTYSHELNHNLPILGEVLHEFRKKYDFLCGVFWSKFVPDAFGATAYIDTPEKYAAELLGEIAKHLVDAGVDVVRAKDYTNIKPKHRFR